MLFLVFSIHKMHFHQAIIITAITAGQAENILIMLVDTTDSSFQSISSIFNKKILFATRCLLGHPLPLETLVGICSAPVHSALPADEKPSLDSQDVILVAHSARSHGRGTYLKKPLFATHCLLDHPLPLEPLVSIYSAFAPSPSPPVHTLLLRRSGSSS